MDILCRGNQDMQGRQLQQQLLLHRGHTAGINGTFDTKSWQALCAFQTRNLEQQRQPLMADDMAGSLPRWSLHEPRPIIQPSASVDYSNVLSRMDRLLGFGHVP